MLQSPGTYYNFQHHGLSKDLDRDGYLHGLSPGTFQDVCNGERAVNSTSPGERRLF